MTDMVLGPLALPANLVWLALAFIAALIAAHMATRGHDAKVANTLWAMLLCGFVVGRLVFVLRYWPQYASHPIGIPDIRDRGFDAFGVMFGMLGYAGAVFWRSPRVRRALGIAVAVGVLTWTGTKGALMVMESTRPTRPVVTLYALDGKPLTLEAIAKANPGKPMVVNLWASWCPPCRAEMPMLADAQKRNRHVVFVFANQGEGAGAVQHFLASESLDGMHNVLLDPGREVAHVAGIRAYPTTLFYDASGQLVDAHMGMLSSATLAHSINLTTSDAIRSISDHKETP